VDFHACDLVDRCALWTRKALIKFWKGRAGLSAVNVEEIVLLYRVPCKGSPYSITERRVPELIPVLGSYPAGEVSHKPGGRLPLLPARPAVTPATLKRAATNFALGEHRHNG